LICKKEADNTMLQVLLFILKTIGIILLCIIVFLLLLAACILLIPVRYRIYGHKYDDICSRINISWLFHLLHAKVDIHKSDGADFNLHIVFKIFGFSLYDNLKPRKKRQRKRSWLKRRRIKSKAVPIEQADKEPLVKPKDSTYVKPDNKIIDETKVEKEAIEAPPEKKNIFQKVIALIEKIKSIIRKVIEKIKKLKNSIKALFDKKDRLIEILSAAENKQTFSKLKRIAIRIVKHVKPRRIKGELYFGFDNPANTGYTLGIVSMMYPLCFKDLKLYPDFESAVFKGEMYIKGRIRAVIFLWYGFSLLLDKNIRRIVKKISKI